MNDFEEIENPPDPARTMEGLRDTGYQFETALADIIDNAVAAGAKRISVDLEMDLTGEVSVFVCDDGVGMDRQGIIDAMRYGAPPRADPASLGKFGLGLKTASTAFCRRLSIISRSNGQADPMRATWDLDRVAEVGAWKLQVATAEDEYRTRLDAIAPESSGTVVAWEKIDRLLDKDYDNPGGPWARRALRRVEDALREHVAQVYQRFLDHDDDRARNIELQINGKAVDHWTPFLPVPGVELVAEQIVPTEDAEGNEAEFTVRAYVLPHRDELSSDEQRAAKISNDRQGIYVYRENRQIHGPDWLGMFGKEPHSSLLRVELSFDHRLDSEFRIDIKKSRILLRPELHDFLKERFLGPPRRAADARYRRKLRENANEASQSAHDASNNAISGKEANLGGASVNVLDSASGTVQITRSDGRRAQATLTLLDPKKAGEVHISPVDGLEDGLLWEPALIDTHKAVRLNTGHPYYIKVYVPNLSEGVTVQGMDSLLWALGAAEMAALGRSETHEFLQEMRYEVSRLLRLLVADLPDPAGKTDESS